MKGDCMSSEEAENYVSATKEDVSAATDFLNDRWQSDAENSGVVSAELSEFVIPVRFRAINDHAVVPQRGTEFSAGYDLYAAKDLILPSGATTLVPLGFATEIHPDYHGRIESRSGMACKGLVVLTGVIDADYRGEWNVIMHNLTENHYAVKKGERVAQVVFRPTVAVAFETVSELSESSRGAGGFGSTGS
jgi:dUTP pyrophosphatase